MSKHEHQPRQQEQSVDDHLSHLPPELNQAGVRNTMKAEEELYEPVQQHLEKPRRYPRKKPDRHH
jgi:hypothetical protein